MILIWSGDGGPLQYLGLAVFLLQFFAPQLFHLFVNIQDGSIGIGSFPLIWLTCSLAMAAFLGGLWVVLGWGLEDEEDRTNSNGNGNGNGNGNNEATAPPWADEATPASNSSGSAANPVATDDNDDNEFLARVGDRINSLLQLISPTHLMLALSFILPLTMAVPFLLSGLQHEGLSGMLTDSWVLPITVLAIIAHSMMAIAAYRVLRDVLDGEGLTYPGNQRGGRRRRGRKLTVSEIADIVRKVPVEEFVSEKDVKEGVCSISRLKRMLSNRGASNVAEKCIDKGDLCTEVGRVRNFNEECAICAEEYAEGDVLRITHCRHEFHLHCFDKWIYTFSTDSRPATYPTCPLCKATIE